MVEGVDVVFIAIAKGMEEVEAIFAGVGDKFFDEVDTATGVDALTLEEDSDGENILESELSATRTGFEDDSLTDELFSGTDEGDAMGVEGALLRLVDVVLSGTGGGTVETGAVLRISDDDVRSGTGGTGEAIEDVFDDIIGCTVSLCSASAGTSPVGCPPLCGTSAFSSCSSAVGSRCSTRGSTGSTANFTSGSGASLGACVFFFDFLLVELILSLSRLPFGVGKPRGSFSLLPPPRPPLFKADL